MGGLEPNLIELQRRAMMGTLCAAIAHEVHTPLDCASVALRQALARVQGAPAHAMDAVLTRELGLALESVTLARAVLRDTMQLAGPAEAPGTTDLSRDVNAVIALTAAMKPIHVVVAPVLEPALRVLGTPTHVQQVVINLLINAFRALEEQDARMEGVVRVTTSPSRLGGRLVVEDNGPGIPSRLRSRLFEPFVASRAMGHGPGLGLHVVKRITLMLGGSIELRSEPGRGTVVVVELPAAA